MKAICIFLLISISANALPKIEQMNINQAWDERIKWTNQNKNFTIGIVSGKTNSMAPYLKGGEWTLKDEGFNPDEIKVDDLVIIGRWDKPNGVCHAVTDVSKTHIKTQGINCVYSDGWKEKKYLKGKVVRVIRIIN